MQELEIPQGYLEKVREQSVVERSRRQTAEAIASCMPRVLAKLLELMESDDEAVALRAAQTLLNKNLPSPLADRPIPSEREIDGEVITEDVREIREKLELEYAKKHRD